MFPMTLNQIRKFENLNISINVYFIEERKSSITTHRPKEGQTRQSLVCTGSNDNTEHFASIKNLSRLVRSQINRNKKE